MKRRALEVSSKLSASRQRLAFLRLETLRVGAASPLAIRRVSRRFADALRSGLPTMEAHQASETRHCPYYDKREIHNTFCYRGLTCNRLPIPGFTFEAKSWLGVFSKKDCNSVLVKLRLHSLAILTIVSTSVAI
jgi:hypothetical protein